MIELIVVDADHTLGECTGPHTIEILSRLSPLPVHMIAEEYRRLLHRKPLTENLISELCTVLHIDPQQWPMPWPEVGFQIYDYTPQALEQLAQIAKVIVLSNMDSASGPARLQQLAAQCDPHLTAVWASYGMNSRKPDPTLWTSLATVYEVEPSSVVHIGDTWVQDVHGPIRAGCHAVFVETSENAPDLASWPDGPGRLTVAADLQHAVADVATLNNELG